MRAEELRDLAAALLCAAGMGTEKAAAVAEVLIEADRMGHDTHGVALLPRHLDEIASGSMTLEGEPEVIADRGATVAWGGRRLPGPWPVPRALDLAMERAPRFGMVGTAIGNGHHMGGLAAYLERVTARGLVVTMASSAPGVASVAPFGGTRGALSPAPFAAGFPTGGDPVLIDISASVTTNNMAMRLAREGRRYERPWLMEASGEATDDPTVLQRGRHGAAGRRSRPWPEGLWLGPLRRGDEPGPVGPWAGDGVKGMVNAIFIQVTDPGAFAGLAAFTLQTGSIAKNCRASTPRPGGGAMRLPGEAGLRRRETAMAEGVSLRPETVEALRPWAERLGIPLPSHMVGKV
ncbi:L-lactate dehydrogenase [Roseomonas rosea]|uniref:L-lactate dehydrogenase n=1 Tax=Muricoccus roseus TaxID=198092 RepID=A0A1M6CFQ3_9PROT|nr:Ldh family oxidoreductase [Roseomonas rosea]SHI59837.1 L-lactate dehydrogenase [Roseomonas rosea]